MPVCYCSVIKLTGSQFVSPTGMHVRLLSWWMLTYLSWMILCKCAISSVRKLYWSHLFILHQGNPLRSLRQQACYKRVVIETYNTRCRRCTRRRVRDFYRGSYTVLWNFSCIDSKKRHYLVSSCRSFVIRGSSAGSWSTTRECAFWSSHL